MAVCDNQLYGRDVRRILIVKMVLIVLSNLLYSSVLILDETKTLKRLTVYFHVRFFERQTSVLVFLTSFRPYEWYDILFISL